MAFAIVGRGKEREKLNKILQSNQAEFLALYGRRRVGKTFLICQHLKERIVFELSGTKDGKKDQQLQHFFEEYLKRTNGQQATQAPTSWHKAFSYLADYLAGLATTEQSKQVVFIDEMPWFDTPKSIQKCGTPHCHH